MRLSLRGVRVVLVCAVAAAFVVACSSSPGGEHVGRTSEAVTTAFPKAAVDRLFATGDFNDAYATCAEFLGTSPTDCDANYCNLIATTMMVVDSINTYALPGERNGPPPPDVNQAEGTLYAERLELALQAAETVTQLGCTYDLASLPLLIGDASDPIVNGEVRGLWTTRTATLLGAIHSAFLYDFQTLAAPVPVSLPDGGQSNPDLPPLLAAMKQFLQLNQALLFTQPTTPSQLQGGWFDRNGDHIPDSADELLIDIFVPGTNRRVFDFSDAEFVPGQALPQLPLTPTFALPPPRCGYQKFHIDDLVTGPNVSGADGITFSPDSRKAVVPLTVSTNRTQLYSLNLDGTHQTCLTCGQPGNNDGARWRPFPADVILFVSTRDHPNAIGGDGAGIGQELYAMRPDGSQATRLTFSDLWATNYHANWSPDGRHIVWGRTENRTWDVMVADFVEDFGGMRLVNQRRIVHDTTWWETHGFTPDSLDVITTNTRAGFNSTDIYAINLDHGLPQAPDQQPHVGRARASLAGRGEACVDLEPLSARRRDRAQRRVALADLRLLLDRPRHLLRVRQPAGRVHDGAHDDEHRRHPPAAADERQRGRRRQRVERGRKAHHVPSDERGHERLAHPHLDLRRLRDGCVAVRASSDHATGCRRAVTPGSPCSDARGKKVRAEAMR